MTPVACDRRMTDAIAAEEMRARSIYCHALALACARVNAANHLPYPAPGPRASAATSAAFVAAAIILAWAAGDPSLAIYALSGWHYVLYFLAFFYGAVPLAMFRRDAIAMKAIALAAFGVAYVAAPIDGLSMLMIAGGFLLNVSAARALGADRTYYGFELAGLAPVRIDAFPYSLTAHPMLIGNAVAFAGTLLNETFRRDWWPLAAAHVALNLAVLWMETHVTPRRRGAEIAVRDRAAPRCGLAVAALVTGAGAALGYVATRSGGGAGLGALSGAYGCALYALYTSSLSRTAASAVPLSAHESEGEWT